MTLINALILCSITLLTSCGTPDPNYARNIAQENAFAAHDAWTAAKQQGIYYRAYGNAPFWMLEVNEKKDVILFREPGVSDKTYDYIQPRADIEEGRTVYQISDSESIIIKNGSCSDSVVGEQFETTVFIKLDDYTYTGCGRALY